MIPLHRFLRTCVHPPWRVSMSINPTSTLKRPWSSSQPSSPTSSSSPKRAASEDSHTSEVTHSQGSIIKSSLGLLNVSSAMSGNTSIPVGGPGSSPLRKSEADGDETGWVRRTEEVHINSDTGMTEDHTSMDLDEKEWVPHFDQETLKEHYNIILGEPNIVADFNDADQGFP